MYKGFLPFVRILQLEELKLSGLMANIEENNMLCDSKKRLFTPHNEKVFLLIHNLFWKKPSKHEIKGTYTVSR